MNNHDRTSLLEPALLVGGEWLSQGSAGTAEHTNPSTGRVQASFPLGGPEEVDRAVAAARAAFPAGRRWSPAARQKVLNNLGELIRRDAEELAAINALEV